MAKKHLSRNSKIAIGVGATAAIGGLGYYLWRKGTEVVADDNMKSDSVDSGTTFMPKGQSITATTTSTSLNPTEIKYRTPPRAFKATTQSITATTTSTSLNPTEIKYRTPPRAFKATTHGPAGWLGWLSTHGALCTAFELRHIDLQSYSINPMIKATWHSHASGGNVGVNNIAFDTSGNENMSQRYAELQSPIWGTGFGPAILDSGFCKQGVLASFDEMLDVIGVFGGNGGTSHFYGMNLRYGPFANYSYDRERPSGSVSQNPLNRLEGDDLYPARNVRNYWTAVNPSNSWAMKGRTYTAANAYLDANKNKKITVPRQWNTDALRPNFYRRLVQWFDTAQSLVWSCEMARIHSQAYAALPTWWAQYANAWGICVSPLSLIVGRQRYTYKNNHADERLNDLAKTMDLSGSSYAKWEKVARALMKAAPMPGTAGYLGEQIAYGQATRHILDMPDLCGSLIPKLNYGYSVTNTYLMQWISRQDFHHIGEQITKIVSAIANVIVSIVGGAAGAAAIAAINAVYAGLCTVLGAVYSLANGGSMWDAGSDIVAGVWACTSAVAGVAGTNVSVMDMLPDDLWEALDTYGAELPKWGGVFVDEIEPLALQLQENLHQLKTTWHWPYTFEGFSTLIAGEVA